MMRGRLPFVLTLAAFGCGGSVDTDPATHRDDDNPFVDEESIATDSLALVPATGPLRFSRACSSGDRVTLAAVGDVLMHATLQRQAYARGYSTLWGSMVKWLDDGQITYANHEGPTARGIALDGSLVTDPGPVYDGWGHTGPTRINVHPSLDGALREASFDVVSTANNHALDRFALGVDRTLDSLDGVGLRHTGTIRAGSAGSWSTNVDRSGFNVRFLACSFSTNGVPDDAGQVLHCFSERSRLLSIVRSLSARSDVDAVIVVPHWGVEFSDTPRDQERQLAHELLDAGAAAVIGAHPHVLQPWEKYVTQDGREGLIAFSLGNFVSRHAYLTLARRTSILLYVGLTRGADGKAFVNGVRYMPTYMRYSSTSGWSVVAIDEVSGFSDARYLATTMFGEWNVRYPSQPLDTTPECR